MAAGILVCTSPLVRDKVGGRPDKSPGVPSGLAAIVGKQWSVPAEWLDALRVNTVGLSLVLDPGSELALTMLGVDWNMDARGSINSRSGLGTPSGANMLVEMLDDARRTVAADMLWSGIWSLLGLRYTLRSRSKDLWRPTKWGDGVLTLGASELPMLSLVMVSIEREWRAVGAE